MIIFFSVVGILAIAILVILLYYNKAYPEAQEIAAEMEVVGDDYYFYGDSAETPPRSASAAERAGQYKNAARWSGSVGFIIFSGAKTDERAYAYLAKLLHDEGYTVVIPKQLFHLSAFGTKHGLEIMDANPQIEKWILIGHSLGGMPASRIAAAKPDQVIGVALLATYASVNLSNLDIGAIRITAENDGIMNNHMMERFDGNLPANSTSVMLEGANHQGFAAYSSSSGRDGEASISWQEQNEQSIKLILDFFSGQIDEV
ncbi:MAG: alpha/beta hydrolase [Lachnospiraceae bacterium]|nr:alpha/beta hydrolase [Lachnospiraceae bacterium]